MLRVGLAMWQLLVPELNNERGARRGIECS